jgi:hypothetical protein
VDEHPRARPRSNSLPAEKRRSVRPWSPREMPPASTTAPRR